MKRTLLIISLLIGVSSFSFSAVRAYGGDGSDVLSGDVPVAAAVTELRQQGNDEAVNSVIFYPNPVKDIITVRFPKKGNYTVMIYNIIGDKVMEKNVADESEVRLDMSDMQNGMFFLSYIFDGKSVTKRFSKSN